MYIISREFTSQGKGKNLILLKLHADFLRDLWLRSAAKTHIALVAVQGFIQEKFFHCGLPRKKSYISTNIQMWICESNLNIYLNLYHFSLNFFLILRC